MLSFHDTFRIGSKFLQVVLVIILCVLDLSVYCAEKSPVDRETGMGRRAAREIESESKIVTDPEITSHVEKLGLKIAEIANSVEVEAKYGDSQITHFAYTFKVLDDESVNAFSLPGGFIYINTGLLDYVQSDDELAAVLAHEIAHSAHHHMMHILEQENKFDHGIMLMLLAGMLSGIDTTDLSNLMIGVQLVRIAKTGGYSQKAEDDADSAAVQYLIKAGYNPVGMLTFLERLASDAAAKPEVQMGIMQTHPAVKSRCKAVMEQIKSLGLPVNRRSVTKAIKATVVPCMVGDCYAVTIMLGEEVLITIASTDDRRACLDRARYMALMVNRFLDSEPPVRQVKAGKDGKSVIANGKPLFVITKCDCELYERSADEIVSHAADVIKRAIWQDTISRIP